MPITHYPPKKKAAATIATTATVHQLGGNPRGICQKLSKMFDKL